jgi:prevent-host-death family protein
METVMQSVRAVDANRQFSKILKQVSQGEEFLVISRGTPVASITSVKNADRARVAAQGALFVRLRGQAPTHVGKWTRDELYDVEP